MVRLWIFHRHVRVAQERGHRQKHPRLRPSHVRGPDGAKAKDPIIKEAPIVPHVIHGPFEYRARQWDVGRVEISKRKERDDALRHTVNVHRTCLVMEVSNCTVVTEKVCSVEVEAASYAGFELRCLSIPGN